MSGIPHSHDIEKDYINVKLTLKEAKKKAESLAKEINDLNLAEHTLLVEILEIEAEVYEKVLKGQSKLVETKVEENKNAILNISDEELLALKDALEEVSNSNDQIKTLAPLIKKTPVIKMVIAIAVVEGSLQEAFEHLKKQEPDMVKGLQEIKKAYIKGLKSKKFDKEEK